MIQGLLFSEMLSAADTKPLVMGLLSLKRCFGSHSKLGIVVGPGCTTDYFGTVEELVANGHISGGLEWIDQFIPSIPTVYEIPTDNFVIATSKYRDNGPPCPWDVAKREWEIARANATKRRKKVRSQLILSAT